MPRKRKGVKVFVGFDSEFTKSERFEGVNITLSYQLCFVDNAGRVRKQVFIDCVAEDDYPSPVKGVDIILSNECTLEELLKKIKSCSTAEKINLISHYNIAEMQSFLNGRNTVVGSDLLLVQNSFLGRVQNYGIFEGVRFVDTIKFTAGGGLDKAGEAIGIPKLTIDCDKSKMLDFYYKDRKKFIEYAMRDAEICARYYYSVQSFAVNQMNTKEGKLKASNIYTASNIGAIYLEERLMSNFLDAYLTGYRKVRGDNGGSKLIENHAIAKNTGYFENALVGGRNETYAYGYFPASDYMMRDYDLKGAYGTAQCVMPMWDFDKPVILDKYGRNDSDDISVIETIIETEKEEVVNKDVFLEKLKRNPLALGVVAVEFRFKDDVLFPSIPVCVGRKNDRKLCYPLAGESFITVLDFLAALPHLKSFRLLDGFFYPQLPGLSVVAKTARELTALRTDYKKKGDDFTQNCYKLMINGTYGKTIQGLQGKKSIDLANSSYSKNVKKLRAAYNVVGPSVITNVAIGGWITAFTRACGAEYLYYISDKYAQNIDQFIGCYTTDGFMVANIELSKGELQGVGRYTHLASNWQRESTGSADVLELKHAGKGALFLKKRGYCMLEEVSDYKRLVAFTGVKFDRELTQDECIALMTDVYCNRERFQDTKFLENKLASARDWLDHLSFTTTSKDKRYNLDFDCWRLPVITNNKPHAQFITRPYFSEVEFAKVLKTVKNSYKNCINKLVSGADYLELFQKPHNSFTKTKNGNWIRAGLALYIEKVASQKEIAEIIGVSDRVFRYHLKKDFVRTAEEYKKGVEKEYSILLKKLLTQQPSKLGVLSS